MNYMNTSTSRLLNIKLGLGPLLLGASCVLAVACTATAGCSGGNVDADGGVPQATTDGGGTIVVPKDGGGSSASPGHLAYVSGSCGTGYTKVGTMSGLTVCLSPEEATAVIASGASCEHGVRVGDYSAPYYKSVCKFAGYLGTAQFASCPSDLRNLEPSANGTRTCGKVDTQLFWSDQTCPTGFRNAGAGLGTGHICRRDQAGALVYLNSSCPNGWEKLGGNYCATSTQVLLGGFDASCPTGWSKLGDVGNNVVMCARP